MKISVAYSPDSDDAFMVYAWKNNLINTRGFTVQFISADIQALNEAAMREQYDICAISVGVYPKIRHSYQLLPVGASIGNGYGPKVVVREDSPLQNFTDLKEKTVAIPGENTSAFLALKRLCSGVKHRNFIFHQIESEVNAGRVDAGLLIHELQLNPESRGLRVLGDLGKLWQEKYSLPLPLGANAIRRALGDAAISDLTAVYKESILWALRNRKEALKLASAQALEGFSDEKLADRYIEMYVNDQSLDIDEPTRRGIDLLLQENSTT